VEWTCRLPGGGDPEADGLSAGGRALYPLTR